MAKIVQETRYELADGELLAMARMAGRELQCRAGEVWITVDGHPEDVILGAGQRWVAADDAPIVVSALKDSLVVLTRECLMRPTGLLARLLRRRSAAVAVLPATLAGA